jgi:D-xylose transport system substrate-binding protein
MRKWFFLYIGFAGIFNILFSCNSHNNVKVGFLLPNMVSDRYLKEKIYFSEKIRELGGEALVTSGDYDDQKQIKQASELIEQGAKVLVVNPLNLYTAAAIIRDAHEHGVPVIAYDRLIRNCDLDYFLTFDNEKVGRLMADYAINIKPEGKYILLGGDKGDQNAVWVKKGQLDALAPSINSGKIKIVFNVFVEDWSGENAKFMMKKYFNLSGDLPDVILSSYDGMSTGVIELFDTYNIVPGQIIITGQDAELAACRNIVKGNQTMTIYKSVKNLACKAAELSMKLVNKEKISSSEIKTFNGKIEVPTVLLDPVVVDKSNLKTTIIADGFIKENDLYK